MLHNSGDWDTIGNVFETHNSVYVDHMCQALRLRPQQCIASSTTWGSLCGSQAQLGNGQLVSEHC